MAFELELSMRGASDEDLIGELRRCAKLTGRDTVTMAEFERYGRCHPSTIQRRFGSWQNALNVAGLQQSRSKIGISDVELFENLKNVWLSLGRQPRYGDIKRPTSHYSAGTYEKRFGSWSRSLKVFVEWANGPEEVERIASDQVNTHPQQTNHHRRDASRNLGPIAV